MLLLSVARALFLMVLGALLVSVIGYYEIRGIAAAAVIFLWLIIALFGDELLTHWLVEMFDS